MYAAVTVTVTGYSTRLDSTLAVGRVDLDLDLVLDLDLDLDCLEEDLTDNYSVCEQK
jgi:hypothetical protein